jgi:hypothetical protein
VRATPNLNSMEIAHAERWPFLRIHASSCDRAANQFALVRLLHSPSQSLKAHSFLARSLKLELALEPRDARPAPRTHSNPPLPLRV